MRLGYESFGSTGSVTLLADEYGLTQEPLVRKSEDAEPGVSAGINPQHVKRLRQILALLETSETLDDMDLPGLNLHELKGKRKGTWAVKVSGNWRVTFKLEKGCLNFRRSG